MTLNHLNLTVTDPEETSAFLAKYFGLQRSGGTRAMQLLRDDNGMVLTLFRAGTADRVAEEGQPPGAGRVRYPSTFHIGFFVESEARVREINERLSADGIRVDPPTIQHGDLTFYFTAPGGFVIEVGA
jgi:catechol 2,3-dioxygenase-like lactoylglutathione lyase family enzyme